MSLSYWCIGVLIFQIWSFVRYALLLFPSRLWFAFSQWRLSMWLCLLPCHWRPLSLSHFHCPILWPSCWSCHMPSMIWSLHHHAHPSFSLKCPPTPDIWIMYSLTLSGSLLKWYLLRGPSLTTTSKIVFPNLLPCFIFPHSIYNLIYMFINLFIYAPPSFALNSVKAGPGFFLFFMNPHKGAQNC